MTGFSTRGETEAERVGDWQVSRKLAQYCGSPTEIYEVKLSHPTKSCSCLKPVSSKRGLSLLVVLWLASTIPTLPAAITFAQANYAVPQTSQDRKSVV